MKSLSYKGRKGLSMIELLVGITIFGLAMVPLLMMGTSTTTGAYSVGKHMMAGQVAASFLDKLLGLSYDKCLEKAQELSKRGKTKVLKDDDLKEVLTSITDKSVHDDMERAFKYFLYEVSFSNDDSEKILRLDVEVFYRVIEGEPKTEQSLRLSVLKYGAKNG